MNRPAVTIPLAAAAFVGMALGAAFAWHQISGPPLRTLDATVADALDRVEAGDPLAFWATDPDCVAHNKTPSADDMAKIRANTAGWTFTAAPARITGADGWVLVSGEGPAGATWSGDEHWHLDRDGAWRQVADGHC